MESLLPEMVLEILNHLPRFGDIESLLYTSKHFCRMRYACLLHYIETRTSGTCEAPGCRGRVLPVKNPECGPLVFFVGGMNGIRSTWLLGPRLYCNMYCLVSSPLGLYLAAWKSAGPSGRHVLKTLYLK